MKIGGPSPAAFVSISCVPVVRGPASRGHAVRIEGAVHVAGEPQDDVELVVGERLAPALERPAVDGTVRVGAADGVAPIVEIGVRGGLWPEMRRLPRYL